MPRNHEARARKKAKIERLRAKRKLDKKIHHSGYLNRWNTLKSLGFNNYQEYLASQMWAIIRRAVMADNPDCHLCETAKANQVHHMKYNRKTMLGLDPSSLIPLCEECHYLIEFSSNGRKLTVKEMRVWASKLFCTKHGMAHKDKLKHVGNWQAALAKANQYAECQNTSCR